MCVSVCVCVCDVSARACICVHICLQYVKCNNVCVNIVPTRVRLLNVGGMTPFRFSIDHHELEVVASDG